MATQAIITSTSTNTRDSILLTSDITCYSSAILCGYDCCTSPNVCDLYIVTDSNGKSLTSKTCASSRNAIATFVTTSALYRTITSDGIAVFEKTGETILTLRPAATLTTTRVQPGMITSSMGSSPDGLKRLTGGQIAGIVIGAVMGGMVLLGAMIWVLERRAKHKRKRAGEAKEDGYKPFGGRHELSEDASKKVEEADGEPIYELEAKAEPAEVPGNEHTDGNET